MARRDDARYVEFVAASQQRMRRSAYLMCGDWQLAADATQEALIRVYVAWPRLERGGALPTYTRKALMSSIVDLTRKSSTRRRYEDKNHRMTVHEPLRDHESDSADRTVLVEAMRELPDRQRACVVLRYFDQLSVAETADALGITDGTVKSQTSRGLATLKIALEQRGWNHTLEVEDAR